MFAEADRHVRRDVNSEGARYSNLRESYQTVDDHSLKVIHTPICGAQKPGKL